MTTIVPEPRHYREAARVVREGWCQGAYDDEEGCHCVMGALHVGFGLSLSETTKADEDAMSAPLAASLRLRLRGTPKRAVVSWNDAPGRTAEDVAEALERCAEELERGEVAP